MAFFYLQNYHCNMLKFIGCNGSICYNLYIRESQKRYKKIVGLQLIVDIIQCSNGGNATAILNRISLLKERRCPL